MSKNLVIVESPAKAKTIGKYLGKDFDVLASYGHVRDLIPKEGAVDTEGGFAMKYQLIERNEKHVKAIIKSLKKADAGLFRLRFHDAPAWVAPRAVVARRGARDQDGTLSLAILHPLWQRMAATARRDCVVHPCVRLGALSPLEKPATGRFRHGGSGVNHELGQT